MELKDLIVIPKNIYTRGGYTDIRLTSDATSYKKSVNELKIYSILESKELRAADTIFITDAETKSTIIPLSTDDFFDIIRTSDLIGGKFSKPLIMILTPEKYGQNKFVSQEYIDSRSNKVFCTKDPVGVNAINDPVGRLCISGNNSGFSVVKGKFNSLDQLSKGSGHYTMRLAPAKTFLEYYDSVIDILAQESHAVIFDDIQVENKSRFENFYDLFFRICGPNSNMGIAYPVYESFSITAEVLPKNMNNVSQVGWFNGSSNAYELLMEPSIQDINGEVKFQISPYRINREAKEFKVPMLKTGGLKRPIYFK